MSDHRPFKLIALRRNHAARAANHLPFTIRKPTHAWRGVSRRGARASYGCDRLHEGVLIFVGWLTRFQRSGGGHRGALTYGTWIGSAGIANVKTGEPMRPDARLRIQSNSKTWLLAVALQLAGEGGD